MNIEQKIHKLYYDIAVMDRANFYPPEKPRWMWIEELEKLKEAHAKRNPDADQRSQQVK